MDEENIPTLLKIFAAHTSNAGTVKTIDVWTY